MGPKKKKGKKGKKGKKSEPKHDSGWEKTQNYGSWDRWYDAVPDPAKWPSFADIREKMEVASKQITMIWSPDLPNSYIHELFAFPRPKLDMLVLRGCKIITRFILSPASLASSLKILDLSYCCMLEYVLIESKTLEKLSLYRCANLRKAMILSRGLQKLDMGYCEKLNFLLVWSDVLEELDLSRSKEMYTMELYCPKLEIYDAPTMKVDDILPPFRPPILDILRQDKMVAFIENVKRWFLLDKHSLPTNTIPFPPRTHQLNF